MSYFKDLYKVTHDICASPKVFGDDAEYTTVNDVEFEIQGVFDNNYEAIDSISGAVISSNECAFHCHLENFPDGVEPDDGDELTIDGRNFVVRYAQEDGQGGVTLILHNRN